MVPTVPNNFKLKALSLSLSPSLSLSLSQTAWQGRTRRALTEAAAAAADTQQPESITGRRPQHGLRITTRHPASESPPTTVGLHGDVRLKVR